MPRWKTVQSRLKIKKKTRLALAVLGFLLALLLLSQLVSFTKLIHRPFRSQESTKNYAWNGEFNLNFVVNKNGISLVSYNPQEREVTIIAIPDETLIDVPFGFGKWQVRSIYDLGVGSKLSGDRLLKLSLSSFFGIPIDGYSSENLVDEFRRNLLSGVTLLPKLKTDLTLLELMRLKLGLFQVRFDKTRKVDLLSLGVLDKEKLADGTEVFVADPVRLDSVMSDFAEGEISNEHLSVAVFNAADKPLLARDAKRLIENLGGNVIVTQNAPKRVQRSYVGGEASKTLKRLTQIFDSCFNKCDKIPMSDLGLAALRAQIIVVLGQDF